MAMATVASDEREGEEEGDISIKERRRVVCASFGGGIALARYSHPPLTEGDPIEWPILLLQLPCHLLGGREVAL